MASNFASTLSWLDSSESERRAVLELVSALNEPGTLDELGIGSVRDTIADFLFPGISTIQTRARYFLFIPWILQIVEGQPNVRAEQFSRQLPLQLCDALDRSHGPGQGVIGREARAALQRWPISIYWLGLERWGIRRQVGSIPDPIRGLIETTVDGQSTVVGYEPDPVLRDTEQVPLLGEGGVEAFFRREVLPYAPDAWYVPDSVKIGYEISFTRHFYKPQSLRPLEEIRANILVLERETEGLLTEIVGGGG